VRGLRTTQNAFLTQTRDMEFQSHKAAEGIPPIGHYTVKDDILHKTQPVHKFRPPKIERNSVEKQDFLDVQNAFNTLYNNKMLIMDFSKQMTRDSQNKWLPGSSSQSLSKKYGRKMGTKFELDLGKLENDFRFQNYLHNKYQQNLSAENQMNIRLNPSKAPFNMEELNEKKVKLIKKHDVRSYAFVNEHASG